MHIRHITFIIIILCCLLTDGDSGTPPDPQQPILGIWGISQSVGYTTIAFFGDGSVMMTQKTSVFDAQKTNGTWKLEGSKLTVTMGSNAPDVDEVISLEPKLLRLKTSNGTVMELRKVKSMGQYGDINFE